MNVRPGLIRAMLRFFPPLAVASNDGLLCIGGDLSPERLLAAYASGIFPWYDNGLPIMWWSPDPRCVLPLEDFHLPARSARKIRNTPFELTWDMAFTEVIHACSSLRKTGGGTWLTAEMQAAYIRLHELGYAHSVETWLKGNLVGGLYGVGLGLAFFGESMFHRQAEASRMALAGLVSLLQLRGVQLLDCQQATPHMMQMGGRLLPRDDFISELHEALLGCRHWEPWLESYAWSAPDRSWSLRS